MIENALIRATGLADQSHMALRDLYPEISRIANGGYADTPRDKMIVRLVFCSVAGDIHLREWEREKGGEP